MHYYKSQELADLYGVSRRTVTNWIKQTQEGKLNLDLTKEKNEYYLTKSVANQATIRNLVQERRKYLNTRSRKYIKPTADLYSLYTSSQIHSIIHSLSINKELPLQYSYIGDGAKIWNEFRSRTSGSFDTKILTEDVTSFLDQFIQKYDSINLVDVGVGNGMGAKDMLSYLKNRNKLKRYIGIDISPNMLKNTEDNLKKWFKDDIQYEMHVRDITQEPFREIIAEPVDVNSKDQKTINLVLLFGGSISNFRDQAAVFRTINRSMGPEDVFACSFRLGTPVTKNQLGFIANYCQQSELVLKMLGINEDYYKVEIGFDEESQVRYGRIRLKYSLQIEFNLPQGQWIVDLGKDESILVYRATFNHPFTVSQDLFYKNGFNPLMTAQTLDHTGMIILSDLNLFNK